MSTEYEAAQEICAVLNGIDQNLDRIYKDMPSQRERIAIAAMQGILVHSFVVHSSPEVCAQKAIALADALMVTLNQNRKPLVDGEN